jgi:hypothetical protein
MLGSLRSRLEPLTTTWSLNRESHGRGYMRSARQRQWRGELDPAESFRRIVEIWVFFSNYLATVGACEHVTFSRRSNTFQNSVIRGGCS